VVIIPWVVYQFYGDKNILEENFDAMLRWLKFMEAHSNHNLYEEKGYGDWVAVVQSPTEPIGSLYYFYDAKLLAHMARILGRDQESRELENLAQKIAAAYQRKHFHPKTGNYSTGTQTMNLLPLAFGITPKSEKTRVARQISEDVKKRNDHLSTGFLGTAFLLPVLTDYDFGDQALRVATQRDYPSWGYMVEHGATTIWELWDSDKKGPDMNSRNHFALGSVGEWYFGYLAGLRPDPDQPGFKHTVIWPTPLGNLTWAKASYQSVYGPISTSWEKGNSVFVLNLSLPANTHATVALPLFGDENSSIFEGNTALLENGQTAQQVQGVTFARMEKDRAFFDVGSGNYRFEVRFGKK
jgi:alpha-L-rhamnosidase